MNESFPTERELRSRFKMGHKTSLNLFASETSFKTVSHKKLLLIVIVIITIIFDYAQMEALGNSCLKTSLSLGLLLNLV